MSSTNVIAMDPAESQLERPMPKRQTGDPDEPIAPALPEIPSSDDLFTSVIGALNPDEKSEKIQKRASLANVMKLAEENKNLEAELKALTDRLEAAEKRAKKREGKPYGAS